MNERELKELYTLYYDRFFRIAYYYAKNEEWSQEIVLDCFMKLWEKRATLPAINNQDDYYFILVKNTALNYLAKEKRHETVMLETTLVADNGGVSPEDSLISDELFAVYVKELDKLPPRCREIFLKVKEEKQTYAQVAEELNISVKTVDAQVQKAVGRLKEVLLKLL
ncbi:RNA polymerase sigma-70 factor [Bacteroides sp. OttesenSCG-928-D19]|nr:RNA polymerase sigma-70 factor [Bacteroides sp. OttesenSCG-928-D19]